MARDIDLRADPWATGPWCWLIDEVRLLPTPLPCKGAPGTWSVPPASIGTRLSELLNTPSTWLLSSTCVRAGPRAWAWSALTIHQPWAQAIAVGVKRVENRTWRRGVPPGGLWLALHAAKNYHLPPDAPRLEGWSKADQARAYAEETFSQWYMSNLWPDDDTRGVESFARGAILGAMHVSAIVRHPDAP